MTVTRTGLIVVSIDKLVSFTHFADDQLPHTISHTFHN